MNLRVTQAQPGILGKIQSPQLPTVSTQGQLPANLQQTGVLQQQRMNVPQNFTNFYGLNRYYQPPSMQDLANSQRQAQQQQRQMFLNAHPMPPYRDMSGMQKPYSAFADAKSFPSGLVQTGRSILHLIRPEIF